MSGFISVHDGGTAYDPFRDINALAFVATNECTGAAFPLPQSNHDTALAGLVTCQPPINPVRRFVGGADMAVKVGTINLDFAV